MIFRFLLLLLFVSYTHSMQKDLALMSSEEYRSWFVNAEKHEIHERVIKPFFNRHKMSADEYQALIDRKAPGWAAQKVLHLQQAKYDRLKNYGAVTLALVGWACIGTYFFKERIPELIGNYFCL